MVFRRWLSLCTSCLFAGCGGSSASGSSDDGSIDPYEDAGTHSSVGTRITGVLGSQPFTLQYAFAKKATDTDPRNWLCIADIPMMSFADCEQSGGPSRTMFLGPYTYQGTTAKWALVQVWLYRVGSPESAWAKSGTIEITEDDPSGATKLTLSVDFGQESSTTGSVSIQ